MPVPCEKCSSFELKLRELEAEIQTAIKTRDAGFDSEEERQSIEGILTEKFALFHQTKLSYDQHRQKTHEISHRHGIRPARKQ